MHFKSGFSSQNKSAVVFDMTGRETETDGVVVIGTVFRHNFLGCLSERNSIVVHVGHGANHQTGQMLQLSVAFQVHHHAVYMVEVFIQVFDKQDFSLGIDVGVGAEQGIQHGEITSDNLCGRFTWMIQRVRWATESQGFAAQSS